MRVTHRLVIVLAFFGALMMLWVNNSASPGDHMTPGMALFLMALPGLAAAIVIYPIAWIFRA